MGLFRLPPQVQQPRRSVVATFVVGGAALATPNKIDLVLTKYAPVVSTPRLVTPPVTNLVATKYAPTVLAPRLATPAKLSLTLTAFAPTVAVLTPVPFGLGVTIQGLGNLQVGGPDGIPTRKVAYKFKSPTTSNFNSVRIYTAGGVGYAGGTGGTIEVTVQADSNGDPSGTALATQSFAGNPSSDTYPLITFGSPASLTAGNHYWLVFRNTDADPPTNYVSVDCIYTSPYPTPMHPAIDPNVWGTVKYNDGSWVSTPEYTGIASLAFANGTNFGFGWLGLASSNQTVAASTPVREVLVPTGIGHATNTVMVRAKLASGSDPLTVALSDINNVVISTADIPATSLTTANDSVWASVALNAYLVVGSTYYLTFSTVGSTQYTMKTAYDGADSGFAAASCFNQGYAQHYSGSWSTWAGTHAHFQWYLAQPVAVTATTSSLVLATFAPTIRLNKLVTPPVKALALTTYAPQVIAPRLATPAKLSLTLTTFVPSVLTPRLVTPGVLALTATKYAPQIKLSVIPPVKALGLATFVPTVSAPRLATPPVKTLSVATFAPTVSTPRLSTPTKLSLVLATFAPTVTAANDQQVIAGLATLTVTTFAPVIGKGYVPALNALSITTYAPVVALPKLVTPGLIALTLTKFAPTVIYDYRSRILADSPVAYWRLGEPSGATAEEEVGNYDATYHGSVSYGFAGSPLDSNTAVKFDTTSTNDTNAGYAYIDPTPSQLVLGDEFTIEAWVRRSDPSYTQYQTFYTSGAMWLGLHSSDGLLQAYTQGGSGTTAYGNAITDSAWHHVALRCTYDGTHHWRLYLDGNDVTTTEGTGNVPSTQLRLGIGGNSHFLNGDNSYRYAFKGWMDEVALWPTVALSPTQIDAHFQMGKTSTVTPGALAVSLSTFAPSIRLDIQAVVPVRNVVVSGLAPTVTATLHQRVTPALATLTLTKFAPVVVRAVVPPTRILTTATFAPTVLVPRFVTPPMTALATTSYAPQIRLSVSPNLISLTTTKFAPTVLSPRLVTPGLIANTLSAFAPAVSATANKWVTPDLSALTLSTFAPSVSSTQNALVRTNLATLVTTGFSPAAYSSDAQVFVPANKAFTLTGLAPVVHATAHVTFVPGVATLATTKFAPSANLQIIVPTKATVITTFVPTVESHQNVTVVPSLAALSLTGLTPTVTATNNKLVIPATLEFSISLQAASVAATANQWATPDRIHLALTTYAPVVTASSVSTVIPDTRNLTTTKFAPSVLASDHKRVTPPTRALTLAGLQVVVTAPRVATPPTKALTLTKFPPQARTPRLATPATKAFSIASFAPSTSLSDNKRPVPSTATLAAQWYAPSIHASDHKRIVAGTRSLQVTRYAPFAGASQSARPETLGLFLTGFAPSPVLESGAVPGRVTYDSDYTNSATHTNNYPRARGGDGVPTAVRGTIRIPRAVLNG